MSADRMLEQEACSVRVRSLQTRRARADASHGSPAVAARAAKTATTSLEANPVRVLQGSLRPRGGTVCGRAMAKGTGERTSLASELQRLRWRVRGRLR